MIGVALKSDTLNSPQGDGNHLLIMISFSLLMSDTLNSPQGDGNIALFSRYMVMIKSQTPSIPRKGTETLLNACLYRSLDRSIVRHPQFPARGRKREIGRKVNHFSSLVSDTLNSPQGDGNYPLQYSVHAALSTVRHPQFPARGRKLKALAVSYLQTFDRFRPLSDTLNSPQGDGNTKHSAHGGRSSQSVRHPQFPARGRKR